MKKIKFSYLTIALLALQSCGNTSQNSATTVRDTTTATTQSMSTTSSTIELFKALEGNWQLISLKGITLPEEIKCPTLTIVLTENKIWGSDSCNNYLASIQSITDTEFLIGDVTATMMYCEHMQVANAFHQAIKQVKSYQLHQNQLLLKDAQGEVLLTFQKIQ